MKVYFLDMVDKYADCLVLDIGAHVGQYTLFAAKMNRSVVAVEPFVDNVVRIHKALVYEQAAERVTLITNAVSNERNQLRWLSPTTNNIGGQGLITAQPRFISVTPTDYNKNKYTVETIWLDDLVECLPTGKEQNESTKQRAILKIDIEGHEALAFTHAHALFDQLDIRAIFMEWGTMVADAMAGHTSVNTIRELIDFLLVRGYSPYDFNKALNARYWREWPWDVIWRRA